MTSGIFLALDGPDGGGKTTQCRLLAEWLRQEGHVVTTCRDPGGTGIGDVIRGLLLDRSSQMSLACEAFLYQASRSQLVAEIIRPALERGEVVLTDRFLLANVAYQGHAGGVSPALVWEMGKLATGGLLPDLTIVLDVDLQVASARREGPKDRIESRDDAYQHQVRAGFLAEAKAQPEQIVVVNADQPVATVQAAIRQEVRRVFDAHQRS